MTNQYHNMAALAGWLEEKCGPVQALSILDQITRMLYQETSLQCMEIMLLADLIYEYRKEMLSQIKEYKALRNREYAQSVATFHVRKELKSMKEEIRNGVTCWVHLRDMYFFEYARYMECCKWPYSAAICWSNPLYEHSPSQTA